MKTRLQTKRLTFSAILTGISVLFLVAAVALPSGRIAALAIAGVPILLLDLALGRKYAVLGCLAASLLCFFFSGSATMLAFLLFFGSYPIVKDFLQARLYGKRGMILFVKFLFFDAVMLLLFLLAKAFLWADWSSLLVPWKFAACVLGGNLVFYFYDQAIGRCGSILYFRLRKYIDQLR